MQPPANASRQPLRVGVVGCGAVAELYHLPALLASPHVEVVAFADTRIDQARKLAALAGASHVSSSHIDLAGAIDLAIVAVPNAYHAPVASDLLEAGVHVLVEKPMARTTGECDRMIAAAAASKTVLAVGHDFRHFPIARFARSLFSSGALGAVRGVDVRQNAGIRWPSVSSEVLSPAAGGGVLMTFGIHLLDLLGWWLGDLRVLTYRDDNAGGVEADVECDLEVPGQANVHFELSRLRSMRDTFVIECERGTLELGLHEPAIARLSMADGSVLDGHVPDPEFDRAPLRTVFTRQLADVAAAIRERREPLVTGAEGRRAVGLVEACYAARQPLRRPWDFPESYAMSRGGSA